MNSEELLNEYRRRIYLIEAHLAGRKIVYRPLYEEQFNWTPVVNPEWDFERNEYQIIPDNRDDEIKTRLLVIEKQIRLIKTELDDLRG